MKNKDAKFQLITRRINFATLLFLCLFPSTFTLAQSSFGLGAGIMMNETRYVPDYPLNTNAQVIEVIPSYSGHLLYEFSFTERYKQEIRATYKEFNYTQYVHIGDFVSSSHDTSVLKIKLLDFSYMHKIRFFKKIPLYGEIGLNCFRTHHVDKRTNGYSYNPNGIANTWNYNTDYNLKTWSFGYSIGLLYYQKLFDNLHLRIEALYSHQLKASAKVENSYTRSLQGNLGLSYSIGEPWLTRTKTTYSSNKTESDKDVVKLEKKAMNSINIGAGYTLFKKHKPFFSLHFSYLRLMGKTNFYLGLGLMKGVRDDDAGNLNLRYVYQLLGEYRPVKFLAIGFYPGLQSLEYYGEKKLHMTYDFALNFQFPINRMEIGPFFQYGLRHFESDFHTGLKLRFKF